MFGFGRTGSMTFPMTYDYDSDGYYSSRRSGWKNLSSLEKALSVALGLVSTLALALMIAVIVVGIKLNKDDYKPSTKPTESTKYPPWVTTISTLSPITGGPTDEVTTRERPTSQPPTTTSLYKLETCVSTECFRAAGDIRVSIDTSVNPCENFYQYSCGGWIKNNPIPESRSAVNQFDQMQTRLNLAIKSMLEVDSMHTDSEELLMAKQFYETCLYQEDEEGVLEAIRWLIYGIMPSEIGTNLNLASVLAKIRKELGGNYIFNLQIDTDLQDNNINAIFLDHLIFGLSPVYLQSTSANVQLSTYKQMIMTLWMAIFPAIGGTDYKVIADNIIKFEQKLLEISTISLDLKASRVKVFSTANSESIYGSANISAHEGKTWKKFADEVMKDFLYNCTETLCDVVDSPNVILKDVEFFEQIEDLLNGTENNIIENYLKWRIILDFAEHASDDFRLLLSLNEQKIHDTKYTASRWENCLEKSNIFLGTAISKAYIKEKIKDPVSFNNKLNIMAESLSTAFSEIIQDVPWITVETEDLVLEKLEKLQILVGYPYSFESENMTVLENYVGLNFTNSSSHFQNVLDLVKWRSEKDLKTILMTSEETILLRDAEIQTTVGSSFSTLSNAIYFPLGILDAPVYRDFDNDTLALNYGSMGMMLARMLIEAFEDTATSYMNETLIGMWDSETLNGFENATDCVKRQYGRYNVSELQNTVSIDGQNTVEMNTADLGGLRIALHAYTTLKEPFLEKILPGLDYSPDQLFFLSFAQTWCSAYTPERLFKEVVTGSQTPAPYRVRGVLENTEEFSQAWNCPLKEDEGLCHVW